MSSNDTDKMRIYYGIEGGHWDEIGINIIAPNGHLHLDMHPKSMWNKADLIDLRDFLDRLIESWDIEETANG